jgi:hypothetical protein
MTQPVQIPLRGKYTVTRPPKRMGSGSSDAGKSQQRTKQKTQEANHRTRILEAGTGKLRWR